MNSRMSGPPVASRSTRRRATVTISVPEASRASRITSNEPNLPVPTISREPNARPAMTSGSASAVHRASIAPFAGITRIRFRRVAGASQPASQPGLSRAPRSSRPV